MGPVVGPVAALLPCLLAQAVTVTAGDRSEVRGRIQDSVGRADVETRPFLRLGVATPRTVFSLGYSPSVSELSVGTPDAQFLVYHSGSATASYRFERVSFSVGESATYGTQNFRIAAVAFAPAAPVQTTAPPATGEPPSGEPTTPEPRLPGGGATAPTGPFTPAPAAPTPVATPTTAAQASAVDRTILFGASSTTAGIQYVVSQRVGAGVSGGYDISGGLDEASRASIAVQKGPYAGARVGYRATRVDALTTVGDARWVRTDDSVDAQLFDLGEEWTHQFERTLSGTLAGGAAVTETETLVPPVHRVKRLDPTIGASLVDAFGVRGAHVEISGTVRLAPVIDRFTGLADQRVGWGVGLSWTRQRLNLAGGVSGSWSVDQTNPNALSAYGGAVSATYHLTTGWSLETGVRAGFQKTAGFAPLPPLYGLYFAVNYVSPPMPL